MDRFAGAVIRHRKAVIVLFVLLSITSAVLFTSVRVNYNMVDYLPPSAKSTKAIEIMANEFTQAIPNANVMVRDVSIVEALEYKNKLSEIEGVTEVMWLDDIVDLKVPLRFQDSSLVETYYKDGTALFMLRISDGFARSACADIRALIGEGNALSGEAVDTDFMQRASISEVINAMLIILPLGIFIFLISTDSWLEPFLILSSIGVAVVINMGTNILFGQVSFLTNSVSPLLQLAVSMDYAIFLMHTFADQREKCDSVEEAMQKAIVASITTISASAMTTLFGFLALVFMQFRIGADLGLILAKGIIVSYVSVVVFLPALLLVTLKTTDRLHHRPLLPDTSNINNALKRFAKPVVVLVMILIVPAFLGQQRTAFVYGAASVGSGTALEENKNAVEEVFGKTNILALLVPTGDIVKERDLSTDLKALDRIDSVMSYAHTVGTAIPTAFLSSEILEQFYSQDYARLILYTDTPSEGAIAFGTIEQINAIVDEYYEEYYIEGQSSSLYDMKTVVETDNFRVNIIAIISIFLVIMLAFKSVMLPFILVITIEAGIWVNLSIPYFIGNAINFIGFLVLSTVQLGATVDYAILLTDHYKVNRKTMRKENALHKALGDSFKSILVSGFTLSFAGFALYLTSSNSSISDIGILLGRGTLLSMFMVLCFLPLMLSIFDKAIAKTTHKAGFLYE